MKKVDKRIFKKEGEELQQYLHFRKRGGSVKPKKGKGSFDRKKFKKGIDNWMKLWYNKDNERKKEVMKMKRIVVEYDVLMAKHMEVSDEEYERLKNEKEPPQDIYDKLDKKLNEEYDGSAAIRIIRSEEWDYSENKTRPIFHFEY